MGIYKDQAIEQGYFNPTFADEKSLAKEAWPDHDPVMVAPEQLWPKLRKCTCDNGYTSGWVMTLRAAESNLSPIPERNWRECDGCYDKRVLRQARQMEFEAGRQPLKVIELPDKDTLSRLTAKWRQWKIRKDVTVAFRAYPQEDGSIRVIHDQVGEPGEPAPTDRDQLIDFVRDLAMTPEGRRVSSSQGWGGDWQGAKGDGRVKEAIRRGEDPGPTIQIWGEKDHIRKVADALEIDLNKRRRGSTELHPLEIDARLTLAEITYYVRDNGPTWEEFIAEAEAIRGKWLEPLTLGMTVESMLMQGHDQEYELIEIDSELTPEPAPLNL